jgi:hypothetical protein
MATNGSHPGSEQIAQFALEAAGSKELLDHLAACPSCGGRVREIQKLAKKISQIPDEEIPRRLTRGILQKSGGRHRRAGRQAFSIVRLITNPLMLVILVMAGMVLMYAWFAFLSQ